MTARTTIGTIPLVFVVLGAGALAPGAVRAATPSEVRSLRGLAGVEVVVENPTDELITLGLNTDQVRADVQSRLQERGVAVVTSSDRAPGRPWLYIRVFAVKSAGAPNLAYFVTAQLRQDVSLDRNPDSHCGASTWDASAGGFASPETVAPTVRNAAQDVADTFITDFLSANAKR